MSIEIILHPQKATRNDLRMLLEELGYKPCEHLWKWSKGTLNYHWFHASEYKSFDGVEATVSKPNKNRIKRLGPCSWMLHTRTRASASPADKEKQNKTIQEARKRFGGRFYNDWYGVNRYTNIKPDQRDAISRGMYLLYEGVTRNLNAVIFSLPEGHKQSKKPKDAYERRITEFVGAIDPTRVLYNALVPFAVASLEHFFGETFRIFLAHDEAAKLKIQQQSRKVELSDLLAVRDGVKSVGDIISDWYSFQSIDSIHKAFSDWILIDFWKILRNSKVSDSNLTLLADALNSMIEFRHGIIHRFDVDSQLDYDDIVTILKTSIAIIDAFTKHVEDMRGFPIRDTYGPEQGDNDPSLQRN